MSGAAQATHETAPVAGLHRPPPRSCGGGVLLAHPGGGQARSYEAAVALQQAQLLQCYVTGFYARPESMLNRAVRSLPPKLRKPCETNLSRRFHPELDHARVKSLPLADLLYLGVSRVPSLRTRSARLLPWRNDWFDRRVATLLRRFGADAVLCYDSCARETFRAARSLGILCVLDQCTAHIRTGLRLMREEAELHPDFEDSLPLRIPQEVIARCCEELELADFIFISSEYGRITLLKNGVPAHKIHVIPYAAEIDRFQPLRCPEQRPFRILFVGQITQRKGIKYLLEACRMLGLPGAELILVGGIVGSGRGLRPYRSLFRHIPSVPYPDLHRFFQLGSVFVMPSLHESGVLAIHEALASGLPVITTPNCGSVVRDGIEGFVVPIRNPEAIAERIFLLYRDADLRKNMSRAARMRAEEFPWAVYRHTFSTLIGRLIATSNGP